MRLLKSERVLLVTVWFSSSWISQGMEIRESWLVLNCCQCTTVVVVGTSCSTLNNPATEGSSVRLGKIDNYLMFSISRQLYWKPTYIPLWVLDIPPHLYQGCTEPLDQSQWGAFATYFLLGPLWHPIQVTLQIYLSIQKFTCVLPFNNWMALKCVAHQRPLMPDFSVVLTCQFTKST